MISINNVIHRNYPDTQWDYKAIEVKVENKLLYFTKVIDRGASRECVEIYSGPNYCGGKAFTGHSYSRAYKMHEIPKKYTEIVEQLVALHERLDWNLVKTNIH